jgi:hypothetical protein
VAFWPVALLGFLLSGRGSQVGDSRARAVDFRPITEDKRRTATLTELSLLLAVLFLGTNPVAVKVARRRRVSSSSLRGHEVHRGRTSAPYARDAT